MRPAYPQLPRTALLLTRPIPARRVPGSPGAAHPVVLTTTFLMDHNSGRACHETYIPTQQPQAQTYARFPSANGNEAGSSGFESTASQGSSAVDAVARFRFSSERRLTRSADFSRVFAEPRRSSDRFFTILARDNGGCGPRLGLAISRRAAKLAVDRNRLKRLARETFRVQTQLPSCDFVVMANPRARDAESHELRASLEQHFARLTRNKAPRQIHG